MTTDNPAAYLAALPPNVQEQLVALTKRAADSDTSEKEVMLFWLEQGAMGLMAKKFSQEHAKLGQMLTLNGMLICALHQAAQPEGVN